MIFLYDLTLFFFRITIRIAAPFNPKARQWQEGRKTTNSSLQSTAGLPNKKKVWVHCSSLGEFEQARPLIEEIRQRHPEYFILLSFFSPSGYEVRKNYKGVDMVCYMPLDGKKRSKTFLDQVDPTIAIFIKYESWYYYLSELEARNIPRFLISAFFTKEQIFFKPWGGFFKKLLEKYTFIFVQDQQSADLLTSLRISVPVTVSGDTRFDQVFKTANLSFEDPIITEFCKDSSVIVAGSTWPEDEKLLSAINVHFPKVKLIIAPHNVDPATIKKSLVCFENAVLLSQIMNESKQKKANVLIIDSIGLLSKLYRKATITYVGGGFNKAGIHNVLEAAVYSKPVLFGPHFQRSREAGKLIEIKAAGSVSNKRALIDILNNYLKHPGKLKEAGDTAGMFVEENKGATEKIIKTLSEHYLSIQ